MKCSFREIIMPLDFFLHEVYSENLFSAHKLALRDSKLCIVNEETPPQDLWEKILYAVKRVLEYLKNGGTCLVTISSHLINYYKTIDLTGFTHLELGNMLKNVKEINKKIISHNQKCVFSFFRAPYLNKQISMLQTRINETALKKGTKHLLYFPTKDQIDKGKTSALLKTWEKNNEVLVGILASKKAKHFGLSGQTSDGLNKLFSTHCSSSKSLEGHIWAVSYNYQLDPITFLADLTLIAQNAWEYASPDAKTFGGIFIVDTEGKAPHSENIGAFHFFCKLAGKNLETLESPAGLKLIDLMERKKSSGPACYSKFPQNGAVNTMEIPTINEVTLQFDEKEYGKRVIGVITLDQIPYPQPFLLELYTKYLAKLEEKNISASAYFLNRYVFASRINLQFIILQTLEKLGMIPSAASTFDAMQYRQKGKTLLKNFDAQTTIQVDTLKKIAGKHWDDAQEVTENDFWYPEDSFKVDLIKYEC